MKRTTAYAQRCARTIAALLLVGAPCVGLSQTGAAKIDTTAPPDFHPSMGDLMTMVVQPRHIKLGLAGKQQNWIYAKYELSELRNAFARIARAIPQYHSIDTAALTTAIMQAPLNDLEHAIEAGSTTQFTEAYTQLTEACNACDRNRNHAAVVIKVPDAAMFSDQEFLRTPR
jgi:hypothetical protein